MNADPSTALLVAHDHAEADVLRSALAGMPVTLDVAYDLPTAIRCLDSSRYSGMILDMADDGADVLRHMSKYKIDLPTVVLSKKGSNGIGSMRGAEHVRLILGQPVEPALLATTVLGLCGIEK